MTATHDDLEPQITDPNALLEVFEQQRVGALYQVDQARESMEQVKNTLNQLFKVPGQDEAAVDAAWKQLKPVRQVLKQMDAVLAGAYNIIETVIEQRDELAEELEDLTDAIDNEDANHPKLETFADNIRDNAQLEGYELGYEAAEEAAESSEGDYAIELEDSLLTSITSNIADQWHISASSSVDVLDAIQGNVDMTNDQREAFKAFLATF